MQHSFRRKTGQVTNDTVKPASSRLESKSRTAKPGPKKRTSLEAFKEEFMVKKASEERASLEAIRADENNNIPGGDTKAEPVRKNKNGAVIGKPVGSGGSSPKAPGIDLSKICRKLAEQPFDSNNAEQLASHQRKEETPS